MDSVGEGEGGIIWENGIEKKKKNLELSYKHSIVMKITIYVNYWEIVQTVMGSTDVVACVETED